MSVKNLAFKSLLITTGTTCLVSSLAFAADYKMNAMCYLADKKDATVQAFNPTAKEIKEADSREVSKHPTNVTQEDVNTKFRIASLSKVLTTHWAVAKLGPEYRFKTTFYVTGNIDSNSCYVHMKGDNDILMGKEILVNAFGQLNNELKKQGCSRIAQLSYDENVVVPNFGENDTAGNNFILSYRTNSTYRGANPTKYYGPKMTRSALTLLVKKFTPIKVDAVKPALAAEFEKYRQSTPMKSLSFKSRPLYMMMREFNALSSNVPPNILFEKLGGATAYKNFLKSRLDIGTDGAEVFNGSGYPVGSDADKKYNYVSCSAFVRVMQDLDHMLRAYNGNSGKKFQMADVMAVGGPNESQSTFKTLYMGAMFDNTISAKTGSANEAITFGGLISTQDGPIYFGVFTHPDAYQGPVLNGARKYIRDLMQIFMERYKLKKFDYKQVGEMSPFDKEADLKEDSTTLKNTLQ